MSNTVMFNREELFLFLGEVALPPWEHTSGELCGSDVDCAPIAQKLEKWVEEHDIHSSEPLLGYATTRELLTELLARTEIDGSAEYSTVREGK